MYTERQKTACAEWLNQLGIKSPADIDAFLDFLYTIATCAIEYEDDKRYEKESRTV